MSDPTPVTMKSIERLNGSSVRPSGTEKTGAKIDPGDRGSGGGLLEENEAGADKAAENSCRRK